MLVLDPSKRISIEEVMKDKWYNEGYENEPVQVISTVPPVISADIHNSVLDELDDLGLEREMVLNSLNEGIYDSLTATYYLVADRRANNPNAPRTTPLSSPTKAALQSKISKATDLECLEEDENGDAKSQPKREKAATTTPKPVTPTKEAKENAPATSPAKVVTGGRRRATVNTAPTNFTPEIKPIEKEDEELPPTKSGRILSASRTKATQIAAELKDLAQPQQTLPQAPTEAPPALPPIGGSRQRAQTMAVERKVDEDEPIPIDKLKAHLSSDAPRTARFSFSVSTTSTKLPTEVFDIVCKTLKNGSVQYTTKGLFATCKLNEIEFEIEVCKLPNLEVVGLRCKRLAGGAWDYKEVLSSLISNMDL
jgi:MAP/microtubule affinity-regulating kinase